MKNEKVNDQDLSLYFWSENLLRALMQKKAKKVKKRKAIVDLNALPLTIEERLPIMIFKSRILFHLPRVSDK